MIVIGIDPGVTGAIAQLGHRGDMQRLEDLPTIERPGTKKHVKRQVSGAGLRELIAIWLQNVDKNEVRFYLESPIAFPGLHSAAIGASFLNAGIIEGVIVARGWVFEQVAPHVWKKALGLGKDKEKCRAEAIRHYPEADIHKKKDHNRAEALLIARYGHELVN